MEITFQYTFSTSHVQWYVLLSTMSAQKCNTTKRYKRNCNFAIDCFRYADSSQLSTGFSYHFRIAMLNEILVNLIVLFYLSILQYVKRQSTSI